MKVLRPMGARVLVTEIESSLSDEEKWNKAGLTLITEQNNRPKVSMGEVVAIGNDPILTEVGIKKGDIVHFAPYAGKEHYLQGKQYRMLEWEEITALESEESPQPPSDQEQQPDLLPVESRSR